ncbi:hydrogenase maturation nickel metallochaperone HypA [Hahella sp. CCB-MM4]|uniref:hydrogenase maturation nickel metallochaperone HypA n=1 Tax=Hahella sp. (strain CCB-MM4) TaxID=1926491 RepID=UPI000B9C1617|nr:hydrogenase maturation nickel metallochaperone HypA [Hahella sp. CCB-MM4]OZG72923.1 hydrogenase maturation nickel metallochaperone HypA [Hahella sp. CCB-MM4]
MHELSLAEDMRDLILEKAEKDGFRKVEKVWLEVGELACVEASAMEFCFSAVMAGTPAQGAKLEIISIPGEGECHQCHHRWRVQELYDCCPECGSFGARIIQGREVRVKSISVI